jgi:hypothetical protein
LAAVGDDISEFNVERSMFNVQIDLKVFGLSLEPSTPWHEVKRSRYP